MNGRVLSELCVCYLYDVLLFRFFFGTIWMREYNVLLFGFRFVTTLNKYVCESVYVECLACDAKMWFIDYYYYYC